MTGRAVSRPRSTGLPTGRTSLHRYARDGLILTPVPGLTAHLQLLHNPEEGIPGRTTGVGTQARGRD